MTKLHSKLKSRDTTLPTKVYLVKAMISSVVMCECECWTIESWVLKNWCFWTMVLEKTLESPLDCKEIQLILPKRDQSWVFIGRTDAETETPILWPPHVKSWHLKRPWCWERLKVGEEGANRSYGWMASLTQWTWVWINSGNWWWTGRPGMLQSMGLQRVGHNWATELNWTKIQTERKYSHYIW